MNQKATHFEKQKTNIHTCTQKNPQKLIKENIGE